MSCKSVKGAFYATAALSISNSNLSASQVKAGDSGGARTCICLLCALLHYAVETVSAVVDCTQTKLAAQLIVELAASGCYRQPVEQIKKEKSPNLSNRILCGP